MNRLVAAVFIIAALIIAGGVAYAVSQQESKTTVVVAFPHGCTLLDAQGRDLSNVTTTFYGYVGLPGTSFSQSYSVEDLGNKTMTLTSVGVNATAGLTATVSPLTFPITLAPGSSTPFSVTFLVTAAATTENSATVTITATCIG